MRVLAIIQARMGSTRLPGKVLAPLAGIPALDRMLDRLSRASRINDRIVAISDRETDDPLAAHLAARGETIFRGSEKDVLSRFAGALHAHGQTADAVLRLTGDCPLIDPDVIDRVVSAFAEGGVEYCANIDPPTWPDGMDCEVMTVGALRRADREAVDPRHREHVTLWLRETDGIQRRNVTNDTDLSRFRLTLDEPADLETLNGVFRHFAPRDDMTTAQIIRALGTMSNVTNRSIQRNEGQNMETGQKLWRRAKSVIPGGNMLLSKRAEMFLPDQWPAYFSKTKGCEVWDLEGRRYRDMSLMGIGTNTLGYGHPDVDAAVLRCVADGNMSTLNAPEEVYLAERLCALHPWAEMARFARSGGEANAIAIRIARAASGEDGVAICGYHGWHDWYLSANLGDDSSLDGHLLPGLEPRGVPRHLKGSVHPFVYNDLPALERIMDRGDVGVIKMEVVRNSEPAAGYLEGVRALADKHGAVLVFDECTSGFRETFGGLHLKYDVSPDLAILGKTLGNGYAVTAAIGRRSVMEAAQSTFISSTFWTERIGSVAALAALDVMERERSWERITETGHKIRAIWKRCADSQGLSLSVSGLPSLSTFAFGTETDLEFKTLVTQEMLKRGWLAGTGTYASLAHEDAILHDYEADMVEVFALIGACIRGERAVGDLLEGPVCHGGFKRLN